MAYWVLSAPIVIYGGLMWRIAALAIVALLATTSAQALDVKSPGPDWTESYHTDELIIFTKDVENGRHILAVSEVNAAPEVVFRVLCDFEHYPEFMPYVEESRVLSRNGENEVITYARVAPPFVSKRDYPLRVRLTRGSDENGGVFMLEWVPSPASWPEVKGIVRVRLNEGAWVVEPQDGGRRTRLTYRLLTNPGGLIPDFVVSLSNTIAIPELFEAVQKRSVATAAGSK